MGGRCPRGAAVSERRKCAEDRQRRGPRVPAKSSDHHCVGDGTDGRQRRWPWRGAGQRAGLRFSGVRRTPSSQGHLASQGETHGTVEKKLASATKIKGHEVKASQDDPQYLVRSDKTGAQAAHKPGALKKR